MIEGNVLKFGYGDIGVYCDHLGRLVFSQLKTRYRCGAENFSRSDIGEGLCISLDYKDYKTLDLYLKSVSGEVKKFEFKDYIFDFTNYNEDSVKVVRTEARKAINKFLSLIAV